MANNRKLLAGIWGVLLSLCILMLAIVPVQAEDKKSSLDMRGGIVAILNPGVTNTSELIDQKAKQLNLSLERSEKDKQTSNLVMANVKNALNVRSEANENAEKIGKLYKDCGGIILDRQDGWTKLQSGNLVGWASDQFLLFDEDAKELADSVGITIATVTAEALRVRVTPNAESEIYGMLPKGEFVEVISEDKESGWVCINYEGNDGYVSSEFIKMDFRIDAGETLEEIKAREEAEREAKRHVNYGAYTADADTKLLLAALIQCEAGGEPYEGQVAVGAVVMNRVRSAAYPDSVHGVIYASGQFTPAMNGKVNRVYESGKIYESCIKAAEEALSGVSNVGDLTHFRRVNGREGLVIGHHVFY